MLQITSVLPRADDLRYVDVAVSNGDVYSIADRAAWNATKWLTGCNDGLSAGIELGPNGLAQLARMAAEGAANTVSRVNVSAKRSGFALTYVSDEGEPKDAWLHAAFATLDAEQDYARVRATARRYFGGDSHLPAIPSETFARFRELLRPTRPSSKPDAKTVLELHALAEVWVKIKSGASWPAEPSRTATIKQLCENAVGEPMTLDVVGKGAGVSGLVYSASKSAHDVELHCGAARISVEITGSHFRPSFSKYAQSLKNEMMKGRVLTPSERTTVENGGAWVQRTKTQRPTDIIGLVFGPEGERKSICGAHFAKGVRDDDPRIVPPRGMQGAGYIVLYPDDPEFLSETALKARVAAIVEEKIFDASWKAFNVEYDAARRPEKCLSF